MSAVTFAARTEEAVATPVFASKKNSLSWSQPREQSLATTRGCPTEHYGSAAITSNRLQLIEPTYGNGSPSRTGTRRMASDRCYQLQVQQRRLVFEFVRLSIFVIQCIMGGAMPRHRGFQHSICSLYSSWSRSLTIWGTSRKRVEELPGDRSTVGSLQQMDNRDYSLISSPQRAWGWSLFFHQRILVCLDIVNMAVAP
ncbi:hypothetical protein BJV78DRAFT_173337 [Lactifluus subvellereus]|nr:hypothetical protein BJV78DRAFT_173337 [Lactifluus subvellereus]